MFAAVLFSCPSIRKMTGYHKYSISSCPIPFHDLVEIWDFLLHLTPVNLYQFDGLYVMLNSIPVQMIRVYSCGFAVYVVPVDLRTFRR